MGVGSHIVSLNLSFLICKMRAIVMELKGLAVEFH
jgi:hypothetical protein